MKIFIFTHGRADDQITLNYLPEKMRPDVCLVVQDCESHLHTHPNLLVLPPRITKLSPARQWVLSHAVVRGYEKILMLDDDLVFLKKRPENAARMTMCRAEDMWDVFEYMEVMLDEYVHISLADKLFANNTLADYRENYRAMRALAYCPEVLVREKCRFDRLELRADFDMTLQLLKLGYKNAVIFKYMNGQKGSNEKGGCSLYRTQESMAFNAEEMVRLHPECVKLVRRSTKKSWGGGTRTDVRINWRKAYALSQEKDD